MPSARDAGSSPNNKQYVFWRRPQMLGKMYGVELMKVSFPLLADMKMSSGRSLPCDAGNGMGAMTGVSLFDECGIPCRWWGSSCGVQDQGLLQEQEPSRHLSARRKRVRAALQVFLAMPSSERPSAFSIPSFFWYPCRPRPPCHRV